MAARPERFPKRSRCGSLHVMAGLRVKTHWCRKPDQQPVRFLGTNRTTTNRGLRRRCIPHRRAQSLSRNRAFQHSFRTVAQQGYHNRSCRFEKLSVAALVRSSTAVVLPPPLLSFLGADEEEAQRLKRSDRSNEESSSRYPGSLTRWCSWADQETLIVNVRLWQAGPLTSAPGQHGMGWCYPGILRSVSIPEPGVTG